MTEEKLIKTVNRLLHAATTAIITGTALILTRPTAEEPPSVTTITEEEEVQEAEEKEGKKREPNPALVEEMELRNAWQGIGISYLTIETEYLGRYFVTAYSDEETNSRVTASGVEVHYSESNFEPTTAAIDRNYHRFGDLLMVDGKVYIAEDTGSGVKGLWIDCFVETMEEVWEWPTGYKSVYSVKFKENYLKGKERQELHERINSYLHGRSDGDRCPYRLDS